MHKVNKKITMYDIVIKKNKTKGVYTVGDYEFPTKKEAKEYEERAKKEKEFTEKFKYSFTSINDELCYRICMPDLSEKSIKEISKRFEYINVKDLSIGYNIIQVIDGGNHPDRYVVYKPKELIAKYERIIEDIKNFIKE